MKVQKSTIIWGVVLLVVATAIVYYLWPSGEATDPYEPGFHVQLTNLSEEEIATYRQRYDELQATLLDKPDDFYTMMELGQVQKNIGDYRGAELTWLRVAELNPGNSTSRYNLANLYATNINDYDKAERYYQEAVTVSAGETLNIQFYRGYYDFVLYTLDDYQKAEEVISAAIVQNPNARELYVLRGRLYAKQLNDKQRAIADFEKALELDPNNQQLRTELANLRES